MKGNFNKARSEAESRLAEINKLRKDKGMI